MIRICFTGHRPNRLFGYDICTTGNQWICQQTYDIILEDSKRSSATSRKCRCDKAKVLSIESLDGEEKFTEVESDYDSNFIYKVGEVIEVNNFCEDRWEECAAGIHFFITRQEAIGYFY